MGLMLESRNIFKQERKKEKQRKNLNLINPNNVGVRFVTDTENVLKTRD